MPSAIQQAVMELLEGIRVSALWPQSLQTGTQQEGSPQGWLVSSLGSEIKEVLDNVEMGRLLKISECVFLCLCVITSFHTPVILSFICNLWKRAMYLRKHIMNVLYDS